MITAARGRDIVVIGASAGGVSVLQEIVKGIPPRYPGSLFIVLHLDPRVKSHLPQILSQSGSLSASHPEDGEAIRPGHIYVAPPDLHMIVKSGSIHVVRGPKENRSRPAIDPMFRSAAIAYGRRTVGVVLTGMLDDGASGLAAVRNHGGITVVQDPEEAEYDSMPLHALNIVGVDYVLRAREIAVLLGRLAETPLPQPVQLPDVYSQTDVAEVASADFDPAAIENHDSKPGQPSVYSCPDCSGTLWEIEDGAQLRFRCRIGHSYTLDHLAEEQHDGVEKALWIALRALEENAALLRQKSKRAATGGYTRAAAQHDEGAAEKERSARIVRGLILRLKVPFDDFDVQNQLETAVREG